MIVRGEPDVSASLQPFLARLAETIAWCMPRADVTRPATCLRDPGTQPRRLEADYFAAVGAVAAGRSRGAGPRTVSRASEMEGRLMVYDPDTDLCDGAAELETGGWFDVFNCPPWDTWAGFFRDDAPPEWSSSNYLVAWVPPVFVELVDRGIRANPEQCIRWLEDSNCGLRRLLSSVQAGSA